MINLHNQPKRMVIIAAIAALACLFSMPLNAQNSMGLEPTATPTEGNSRAISIVKSFPFPAGWDASRDAAWDGRHLWIGENGSARLHEIDPSTGEVLSSFEIFGSNPMGLACDGTNLYCADYAVSSGPYPDHLVTYTIAGGMLNSWELPDSPDATSNGAAYDPASGHLWVSDSKYGMVYELDPSDGTVISSFVYPGTKVRGLTWNDGFVYAVDDQDLMLYKLDTDGNIVKSVSVASLGGNPEGLTFDGRCFWITDNDAQMIYKIYAFCAGMGSKKPELFPYSYSPPSMQLIPKGAYEMGDHKGTGNYDELPVHPVYIDSFHMDTFQVTSKEYCAFLNSMNQQGLIDVSDGIVYKKDDDELYCHTSSYNPESHIHWNGNVFMLAAGKNIQPMIYVSWYGAVAYANWRSVQVGLTPSYDLETWECDFSAGGYRLPTEAEWEKAARGGEHSPYYEFPWGDTLDGSKANYEGSGDPFEGDWPETTPVGYYDGNQTPSGVDMANGYGLYDMAGNVWEWCNDLYADDYYQQCIDQDEYYNPKGPSTSYYRTLRGGSWINEMEYFLRCSNRHRNSPIATQFIIGFRLVKECYDAPAMRLIPSGEYEMGDHLGTGFSDELPVHAVRVDEFSMDTFEVSNEEYCLYLRSAFDEGLIEVSGGVVYKMGDSEPYCDTFDADPGSRIHWDGSDFTVIADKDDHPVVMVSWYGAAAYANWRSLQAGLTPCYDLETWECTFGTNGYRLPTEAEWEKAARGNQHNPYLDFPWGNNVDGYMANFAGSGDPYEGDLPETTPVGYYNGNQIPSGADMANGYGLYDMAGNVFNWCNDWYDESYYQYCVDQGIYYNPEGPAGGSLDFRTVRGGSWYNSDLNLLRCARRPYFYPSGRANTVGFRLILSP